MSGQGRRAVTNLLYSFAMLAAIGYFSFAALQGEYGLGRLIELRAREERLAEELAAVKAEREVIANRVERMSDRYLDLDLLDETARSMLGLARPDEIIIR